MLERFRAGAQREIQALKKSLEKGSFQMPSFQKRPDFVEAIRKQQGKIAVIAEYKRASPSKGVIRDDLDVEKTVSLYEKGGASAISILTEEKWFQGDFSFLDRARKALINKNIPILRKDFIFDPVQIMATANTAASAVLLIVRATSDLTLLRKMMKEAQKWGLQCVVEIFDDNDLRLARKIGAEIIQVNARDLNTLQVNREACLKLIGKNPPIGNEIWIAASGMENGAHLRQAAEAGFSACLIGSSLMAQGNPGNALSELLRNAD